MVTKFGGKHRKGLVCYEGILVRIVLDIACSGDIIVDGVDGWNI